MRLRMLMTVVTALVLCLAGTPAGAQQGNNLRFANSGDFLSMDQHFSGDVLQVFDVKHAMAQRNILGAPGTKEVGKQLARWRRILGS